jgi:hypothetical protein
MSSNHCQQERTPTVLGKSILEPSNVWELVDPHKHTTVPAMLWARIWAKPGSNPHFEGLISYEHRQADRQGGVLEGALPLAFGAWLPS